MLVVRDRLKELFPVYLNRGVFMLNIMVLPNLGNSTWTAVSINIILHI